MIIARDKYLRQLIEARGNGMVKIVTGMRRSGKSFLLMTLFHQYLIEQGVAENHIIEISLDNRKNKSLRNPDVLLEHIEHLIQSDGQIHYVILDEVQLVDDFVEVLLSLMQDKRLDVYVSGSNSKFLSKDVVTEFRGRGDEIHLFPLSFAEYYAAIGGDKYSAWKEYYTYGGLPQILQIENEEKKINYLLDLYELTYIKDIIERNRLRNVEGLRALVRVLASNIGSSTNPKRIGDTFLSVEHITMKDSTIRDYIKYLQDAYMIEEALRYDVKGRKYIGTETKYYFADMGLRAAILNFRQQEETHIMENIIYNELRMRGYRIDVGLVETWKTSTEGKNVRVPLEVDFVVNKGAERIYIQSAFRMPTEDKVVQEKRSLLNTNDNFRKIIIVGDDIKRKTDEQGIITMSLYDFLLDPHSIDRL
ncbi:MAG: ATP-binding protein [Paludibacteraceae bacterium]|nr:ATP-binding protein [Paludibacteraceae bacterium]